MIDRSHIGRIVYRHAAMVEQGRLRFFAKAIGETGAAYTNGLLVPPTFLFCLEMERPDPYGWFASVGLQLPKILHGTQSFRYYAACHAGDELQFEARIDDIYEKDHGRLEFLAKSTRVTNQDGVHVADLSNIIVQRHAVV